MHRRRHRKKSSLIALALFMIIALTPASVSATQSGRLGVFRGSGRTSEVAKYQTWLGQPVTTVLDFIGRAPTTDTTPWGDIDDPSWVCNQWKKGPWHLLLSAAMLPNAKFTLADGQAGLYNKHWKRFGATLVATGCADATIRLGWEFNAKFYPWAAGGKEAAFAGYWRQIVKTLRAVPNQQFRFNWCPLAGATSADVVKAWPGSAYVDVIGLDAYDTTTLKGVTDPRARWDNQLKRPYGLNWLEKFAAANGRPMSFPEWGVTVRPSDTFGGGDNPYYITKMWQWIHSKNVAYSSYFEMDGPTARHRLMTTQFPKSSAEYRRLVKAGV